MKRRGRPPEPDGTIRLCAHCGTPIERWGLEHGTLVRYDAQWNIILAWCSLTCARDYGMANSK